MSIFAIGDLHLSLGVDKPMDIFGEIWENHPKKIKDGFACVSEDDLVILAGDSSWGMSLSESLLDFQFIDRLPGKKLLLKGNHDYWWETVTKTHRFFDENGISSIDIIHNNAFLQGEYAVCGTRGWFIEEEMDGGHNEKVYRRELGRLEMSLNAAKKLDAREILCFLHYPPISQGYECDEITDMLAHYGVSTCCYGHLHGKGHLIGKQGKHKGVLFKMISADFLKFVPLHIRD